MKTEGSQEIAAAKSGMDAKTARKYRRLGQVPSELPAASALADTAGPLREGLGGDSRVAGGQRRVGSQDGVRVFTAA